MASVLENTLSRVLEAAELLDLNPGVRLKRNTMIAFRETCSQERHPCLKRPSQRL